MGIRSYAQNFEDVMLWRALQGVKSGYYIDIGAYHPVKHSVTKAFFELGWTGIHVEPVPEYAEMLRADRPNDQIIQAVVSNEPGTVTFYAIAETGLSTGQRDIAQSHAKADFSVQEIIVPALTLDQILESAQVDEIHFLKIDVEGMEQSVLQSWQKSTRKPWVVVIEATVPGTINPAYQVWEDLILTKGYRFAYADGLNRFYVSNEHEEYHQMFSFPPNVFDSFQIDRTSDFAIIIDRALRNAVSEMNSTIEEIREDLLRCRLESTGSIVRPEDDIRGSKAYQLASFHQLAESTRDCTETKSEARLTDEDCGDYQNLTNSTADEMSAVSAIKCLKGELREFLMNIVSEKQKLQDENNLAKTNYNKAKDQNAMLISQFSSIIECTVGAMKSKLSSLEEELQSNRKSMELLQREYEADKKHARLALQNTIEDNRTRIDTVVNSFESLKTNLYHLQGEVAEKTLVERASMMEELSRARAEATANSARVQASLFALVSDLVPAFERRKKLFGNRGNEISALLRRWMGRQTSTPHLIKKEDSESVASPSCPPPDTQLEDLQETRKNATRSESLLDFLALPPREFFIQCYILLLGRQPESEAQYKAESALRIGRGRLPMLINIYNSKEARAYRQNLFKTGTDSEFVDEMFRRYLGRPVEPDGLEHYVTQLQLKDRQQVKGAIAESGEARAAGTLWNDVERLVNQLNRDGRWWKWDGQRRRLHHLEQEIAIQVVDRLCRSSQGQPCAENAPIATASPNALQQLSTVDNEDENLANSSLYTIDDNQLGVGSARIARRMRILSMSGIQREA